MITVFGLILHSFYHGLVETEDGNVGHDVKKDSVLAAESAWQPKAFRKIEEYRRQVIVELAESAPVLFSVKILLE